MVARIPSRRSATGAAEDSLRDAILSGEFGPGDRLPPERELSERLGVSRLTLRAALATLASAGLITARHGSGYFVRDVRETGGPGLLPDLLEIAGKSGALDDALADLLRLRRHLAAAVLEALVERRPPAAARRAFAAAVAAFADAASTGDIDAIAAADIGVIRALLDATSSMVLRVCLNPIVQVVRDDRQLREAMYAEPDRNLDGWRALAAWLDRPSADFIPLLIDVLAERDRQTIRRAKRQTRRTR